MMSKAGRQVARIEEAVRMLRAHGDVESARGRRDKVVFKSSQTVAHDAIKECRELGFEVHGVDFTERKVHMKLTDAEGL